MLSHNAADRLYICCGFIMQLWRYSRPVLSGSMCLSANQAIRVARQTDVVPSHVAAVQHQQSP